MIARPDRVVVIAGTGTEVGKTWVAVELIRRLRERGVTVAARKPAQSFEAGDPPDLTDAGLLAAATAESIDDVCPPHRWYPVAMAPPMAADALGRRRLHLAEILGELDASWRAPAAAVGLIELAGGIWSPIAHDGDGLALADVVRPAAIVLVADAGLGTLNAVRPAVAALGPIAPVTTFLNRYDPNEDLHQRNRDWLTQRDASDVVVDLDQLAEQIRAASSPS